jgi:tetratricopeptide (TPR) repeat protein
MRRFVIPVLLAGALIAAGCSARAPKTIEAPAATLAELRNVQPDLQDVRLDLQEIKVEDGLDQAMQQYRRFLDETPGNNLTPDAMRRLADLQVEKQFGIRSGEAAAADQRGPVEAIALYDRLLAEYPDYGHRDQVLYQKARAYDELGLTE